MSIEPTAPTLPPFEGEITPLIRALARALNAEGIDAAVGEGDLHLAARMAPHLRPDAPVAAGATVTREQVANLVEAALRLIGEAWDDGNAAGLDGWTGPGRGSGEVDREAQHARTRMVHRADDALTALGLTVAPVVRPDEREG